MKIFCEGKLKRILITGANSYVGISVESYLKQFGGEYSVDTVDMRYGDWREKNFGGYDAVFHVAGIAHSDNGKVNAEKEAKYYSVNTDLAVETAQKAKADGVGQFIFMSTILVYGTGAVIGKKKVIDAETPASPATCYAKSKLLAEERILPLADDSFCVSIVRSPMIYGKGSRGNYPLLAKMASELPFFPKVKNERSMLYIENLCELVRLLVENRDGGFFYPQNKEYVVTSNMVRAIAEVHGRKMRLLHGCGPALHLLGKFTPLVNKAFGSLVYDKALSLYRQEYCVADFEESIIRTEK